ncbi:MAG: MoaD/ThiS family protein, partial [Anaerolineae bacterium]
LEMPTEERGITFINGDLSAMPGLQPDLDHKLTDGDRVAFFHLKSMWPFQYRHDVAMLEEFKASTGERPDGGLRSRFDS